MSNRFLLALALVLALGCKDNRSDTAGTESAIALPGNTESSSPSAGDYRSIAEKVVAQSAGVQDGDLVWITGSNEDLPLLEEIAVEVRKRGASPLVTVASQQQARRMFDEIPAKYDARLPEMNMKLTGIIDVFIATEFGEGRTLKGVSAERIAARNKASAPIGELARKRGVRAVFLGNGLYPNAERAAQLGMSRDELADLMYRGVDADYEALQSTGDQVRSLLAGGKELRITNPNGTDFRVGINNRPVTVSDGIISAADRKKGGAANSVWLPAGEVFLTPVPGTATGTVVSDRNYVQGELVDALRLEFKAGKLTSMTAKSGLGPLQALYDAAGQGKDLVGVIDIGINPGIKVPHENPLHVWSKAGTVAIVVGNNAWAGGDNQVNFTAVAYSPKSTVTVDGKVLVKDGELLPRAQVAAQ